MQPRCAWYAPLMLFLSSSASVQRLSCVSDAVDGTGAGYTKEMTRLVAVSSTSWVSGAVVERPGSGRHLNGCRTFFASRRMSQKYRYLSANRPLLTAAAQEVTVASVRSSGVHW